MNLVEIALVAAIAEFQDRALNEPVKTRKSIRSNEYECYELVDLGDQVITHYGFGPDDWE